MYACYLCLWQQNQIKQAEANVPKAIERRSLLPRMIYLSIQCASSSLKENVETNGSVFDPNISLELKILLERYTKFLGFPFQNAVEMLFATSSGRKSSEVSIWFCVCLAIDLIIISSFTFYGIRNNPQCLLVEEKKGRSLTYQFLFLFLFWSSASYFEGP